ncbi:RxLR effector protein [Phytophthora cinnamomi]|uniref:RxLR effector protein n=1 Tax=Phytophthora cinnamomi TaxID=4785 RepID=UPI00355A0E34|nr:RxLR effector protein [Phytophthora cinnamomi]
MIMPLHAFDLDPVRTQAHRQLRSYLRATANENNDISEERAFENFPRVAKLVEKLKSDKQKAVSKYFTKLQLDKTTPNLFESPKFQEFERFVAKTYKRTPDATDAAMVTTLITHHGDEAVAKMLAAAKEATSTKALATKLEGIQFSNWLREGKTADDVFILLKLDRKADDILENPALKSWVAYVHDLNENPYKLLLSKLHTRYTDMELASMFAVAKQRYTALPIAEGMETAQLNWWMSKKLSADSVFSLLKLDEEGDKLFQNPLVKTWAAYVRKSDASNSDKSVFLALKTHYGEKDLTEMLIKNGDSLPLAQSLKEVQFKNWIADGKTANEIFTVLNLQKEGEKTFESGAFSYWTSYVKQIQKGDPDEIMLLVLKKHYDDESLKSMIVAAKGTPRTKSVASRLEQKLWLSEGKSVENVFKILKLDEKGDDFLKSPELGTWVTYVQKMSNRDKISDELAISMLEREFGASELAMMISSAKTRGDGNKEALAGLQRFQFEQWLKKRETPDRVSHWISSYFFDSRSTGVVLDYRAFFNRVTANS